MSKIVVFEHLTLNGVMQAPGRPDEDRRGGFAHGGWARPRGDAVMDSAAGDSMTRIGALLRVARALAAGDPSVKALLKDIRRSVRQSRCA